MADIKVTPEELRALAVKMQVSKELTENLKNNVYRATEEIRGGTENSMAHNISSKMRLLNQKIGYLYEYLERNIAVLNKAADAFESADIDLSKVGESISNSSANVTSESYGATVESAKSECNNDGTKYKQWFFDNYGGLDPNGNFGWCDRFASWLLAQMGFKMPAGGCDNQRDVFVNKGGFHNADSGYVPKSGDEVFFDWDNDGKNDHVGILYIEDGVPYVLQGNIDGKVCYYKVSDMIKWNGGCVTGYGDPTCLEQYGV